MRNSLCSRNVYHNCWYLQCEKNSKMLSCQIILLEGYTLRNYYYHHELEFAQAALSCQHGGWPFLLR